MKNLLLAGALGLSIVGMGGCVSTPYDQHDHNHKSGHYDKSGHYNKHSNARQSYQYQYDADDNRHKHQQQRKDWKKRHPYGTYDASKSADWPRQDKHSQDKHNHGNNRDKPHQEKTTQEKHNHDGKGYPYNKR